MKKLILLAICITGMACYTPMNNSGVSTNKPWLDVSGTRLDFKGDQYDSCVKFNIRFWPQEAANRINLVQSCITACCWRSEQNEIILDFNKDFEKELATKGRALKYSPGKVTLKVTHSNFVNLTKVTVSPHGIINNKGLLKLSYEEVENPARITQLQTRESAPALSRTRTTVISPVQQITDSYPTQSMKNATASVVKKQALPKEEVTSEAERAKLLLQQTKTTQIDTYFYQMNKTYRKQGAIFMLSDRLLQTSNYGQNIYLVNCHAKARTGIDEKKLKSSDFPCGKWLVNLANNTVTPYDTKAKTISKL